MTIAIRHDWKKILRSAWSVRLMLLAGLLSGAEVALQIAIGLTAPTIALAVLSGLVTAAALVARIIAQREFAE